MLINSDLPLFHKGDEMVSATVTRKHHFISNFYLAGFTASGKKDNTLWVLDKQTLEQRLQKTSNIAHQKDLPR